MVQTQSRVSSRVRTESELYVLDVPRYDCLPSVGEQVFCLQEDRNDTP